jgi:hypothetical protein
MDLLGRTVESTVSVVKRRHRPHETVLLRILKDTGTPINGLDVMHHAASRQGTASQFKFIDAT